MTLIDEFITALGEEIEAVKAGKGGSAVRVVGGRLVGEHGGVFVYAFTLENFITAVDDSPVQVQIGPQTVPGQIVQARGLEVAVAIERDLGPSVPEARLLLNLAFLNEMLLKRFEAVRRGELPADFGQAERVFAGRCSQAREAATLPPLEPWRPPNPAQERAIIATQNSSLTLVWGPPGTGKSATLARVAECYVKRGLRVLVVAHANAAVDEVTEDIARVLKATPFYAQGQVLRLGNHQKPTLDAEYDLVLVDRIAERLGTTLRDERTGLTAEAGAVEGHLAGLADVTRAAGQGAALEARLRELDAAARADEQRAGQVREELRRQGVQAQERRERLARARSTGALKRLFLGLNPERLQRELDEATLAEDATRRQLQELQGRQQDAARQRPEVEARLSAVRRALTTALAASGLAEPQVRERERALAARRDEIAARLGEVQRQLDDLQRRILADARVVCTTLAKTFSAKDFPDAPFDVLIVDEASMAPMPYLYWALGRCRRAAVIAGDFQQLPPICIADADMARRWLGRSIYKQLGVGTVEAARSHPAVCLLDTQYRMDPAISGISNELFYDGLLRDDPSTLGRRPGGGVGRTPLTVVDTSDARPWCSRLGGGGRFNLYHAVLAARTAQAVLDGADAPCKVGIISPYAAQVRLIGRVLGDMGLDRDVRVATVHRFQGGEEDVIIFDTVEGMGVKVAPMLDDTHADSDARLLLNVALTRAKRQVIALANLQYLGQTLSAGTTLARVLSRFGERVDSRTLVDSFFTRDYERYVEQAAEASVPAAAPPDGSLFDERSFYPAFLNDLKAAEREVIVLSPFLSTRRAGQFLELLRVLVGRGVQVRLFTRPVGEQTGDLALHAAEVVEQMRAVGVQVTERRRMHQKVAIIDRAVAWEGSLNILSHRDSGEQMRRLPYASAVNELVRLFDLDDAPTAGAARRPEPVRTAEPCPVCGQAMVVRVSQYGPFLSCPNRGCAGKRGIGRRDRVATEVGCKACGEPMLVRTGSKGPFLGCSGYPECVQTTPLR